MHIDICHTYDMMHFQFTFRFAIDFLLET
uniref:Uncharacterized protein n=1 Tax=Anguilla anguilla TaxID=7936 RepID=A0A0E9QMM3_ANGAN